MIQHSNDDPTRDSFDEYYMPLIQIKDFDALIDNKPFFDQTVKNEQENKNGMKKLSKCQEIMITQQEIYENICVIKNIMNLLV